LTFRPRNAHPLQTADLLRFDNQNKKLIGLFGLGDPVYSIGARDRWFGWDNYAKKAKLYHVMDAYVLGAVPPYSQLLCGKLIAMLALSNGVRRQFRVRYGDHRSLISERKRPPWIALLTTSSALGRSSLYNRLRVGGTTYWSPLGYTRGSGEFHFSNGVYDRMKAFADDHCDATAKTARWGTGFRNRREVVGKCLAEIGLSSRMAYHGIRRELFAATLGESMPFLVEIANGSAGAD